MPDKEAREVSEILQGYGLPPRRARPWWALRQHPEAWVDFMMRFELGLERPDPKRALTSAATSPVAYVAGGLIPLAP